MPTYRVTDSVSGVTLDLTGDSSPTEQELQDIFRGYKPPEEPKPEDQSVFRQVADVPLQFGTGIAQGVRAITDSFGADNAASQNIRGVEDYLSGLLSAQAKQDQQEVARIFQEAEGQGLGSQLAAGLRAVAVSPVDFLAQGLGTAVPTIAGGLAGAALKGGTLAARAATAARVGTGIGAVSGTGIVKSTIYDEVKRELEAAGVDEETAEERAKLAQEYGGENLDQILLGAGLGGLAAGTGLEKVFASRILKNAGIVPKSLKTAAFAGAKEAAPEFIQAAQEQIAGNVALQREGFEDIPTMRGVATAAALEGAIGFGLGAGINVALPEQQQQQYDAARANITNEVDREREAALLADQTKRAQEFVAAINAENQRRLAGQDQQINIDAEAAAARTRAADIAAPNQDEVDKLATPMRGVDVSNDVQFGVAYGQKIARTLGDYFPNFGQFSVTQGDTVRDEAGEPQPTFAIIDTEGNRYGQPLRTFEQANATAYSLNKEVINQNVRGAILNSLETSGQAYDPETTQRLFSYGYRTLNPDANLFSTVAINEAAQTVGPQYAEALSWRQLEALPQVKKKGKVVGYEYTPEGGQTRIITGLTKAQEINKVRSQEGKAESSVFNLEETRANLGNNFSRLTKDIPIDLQTTPLSQPTLEFIRNYDAVTGRPITSFYKNAVLNAVTDLLRSKNVTSKIDSPEINALSKNLIGKDSIKGMDYGESRLFLKKLAGLPRFEKPTQLPVFEFKPYNRENFVRASKFLQQSNAKGAKPDRDQILEAAGISKEDPKVDEKFSALETDLAKQGVRNQPQEPLALPAPPGGNIDLESLRKALRAKLKGFGLQDINLSLERNLIKPTGEIAPEETEAMFIPAMRQIFLAVDRIDPDGSLTPEQRLNALSEVMGHEIIHAVRLLDLWKPTEWSSLEKAVSQIKKPGTNQTYLQVAQRNYADQNAVIQIEEAVADMYRDYVGKRLKIAGKPQNLLERLSQFFQRLSSALAGTGFQTYGDVINRLESGVIGARQRGEIRTLRATEEAVAEAGRVPERLQGILGTPIPRAAAVSPAAPVTPAAPTVPSTVRPGDFDVGALAGADVRESRLPDTYPTAYQRRSVKTPSKATPKDVEMAEEYQNRTGQMPYLSDGQLQPEIPEVRYSIKRPYETKDLAKGKENDPILGLPLNKNGTVTLYYPATNEAARRTAQDKRLKGAAPTSNRIYLTNESSGPKVMKNPGNIDQPMDGANVLIQVDPSLLHIDQEYEDGRKDFFIQLAEGESYAKKMKQTKLFTLDAPRTRALSRDTKLVDIERSISGAVSKYLALDAKGKRARLKQARDVLKKEHNVGTLMGENGKLQKTRIGDYGLTYEGKSVASMGVGLASAQRINEQNLSTCPKSAICEGLCLGETSGQNLLYGGEGQFKSGPRLSQYLKTEAIIQNPEEFSIVLYDEIAKFEKWSNSETGVEQVENEAGEQVMQPKQVYQPAIRLNVTSDFRPQTFAAIINAFPNVMFYDYTKLPTRSIAPNHHLTYSSTGASQIVNGETIVNPETNWDRMVQQLNNGMNVAMAFTSRTDMPDFVVDERTGQRFQVWDGDNYDARFLDPKREDGIGMIVGLTNKDKTTKSEDAAKKYKGFFLDYDRARDGDALVIPDQRNISMRGKEIPPPRETPRPQAQLDQAVANAEADVASTPSMAVPLYNPGASPEALYVAQNPEQGLKLTPDEEIRYSRNNQPQYQPGVQQVLDKLTKDPPAQTPAQTVITSMQMPKFRDSIDKMRQQLINNYSRLEFYIKNHPSLMHMTAGVSSLVAAEFADRSKALFAAAVKGGVIVYKNGGFTIEPFVHNGREYKNGLIDVLAPLYNNPYGVSLEKLAQGYAIARRGERLTREGKLVPGDPADFPQLLSEVRRYTNPDTGNSIIEDWYDTWQAYNSNTVKFLRDTGMIDDAGAKLWLSQSDYFPFYRTDKTGKDISHPKVFGGLTSVTNLKALKGGEEAIDVPLMEAILTNLDSAIAMGMKNVAQQRIVRDMITIGLGRMVQPGQSIDGRPAVTFKVGGKKYSAFIDDPLIFESMQAVPEVNMDNLLGNLFRVPAQILRELIVRDPGYVIANMLRDTGSVVLTSGSNIIPVLDTIRNFGRGLENLEKVGVAGGYDFARDPSNVVKFVSDEARKRGHEFPVRENTKWDQVVNSNYIRPLTRVWNGLGKISDMAEASTRNAVYEDTMSRTGDWVQAAYDALSVINYGRRGRNAGLRVITASVPFLNARIQGLDKLYQAGTGRSGVFPERKKNILRFVTRAGLMVGLTGLYYAMVSDDELYENENPEVRDNYYIIPIEKADLANKKPGFAFKIPIPFEVGILFKTIPERIMDAYYKDAPSKDLKESLKRAVTSTLAINPIPQVVLPIFETVANYDTFTGRSIIPQYMLDRDPIAQSKFGTNELARRLGEATGISPLKLDHLMNGYLGSLGTYTLDAVDSVLRDNDRAYPERKWFEYPFVRRFFSTAIRPGLQEQFYELDSRVNGVVQSMNALRKEGRVDELQTYIMENQNILAVKQGVNVLDKMMKNYRDQKNMVLRMDIDPEEKRRIVDELDRSIALQLKVMPELRRYAYDEQRQTRQ